MVWYRRCVNAALLSSGLKDNVVSVIMRYRDRPSKGDDRRVVLSTFKRVFVKFKILIDTIIMGKGVS